MLYRAESRANRKAKAEEAKRRRYYLYRPAVTVTSQSLQPSVEGAKKLPGLCFLCQKLDHWKNTCELAKRAAVGRNNKLSI